MTSGNEPEDPGEESGAPRTERLGPKPPRINPAAARSIMSTTGQVPQILPPGGVSGVPNRPLGGYQPPPPPGNVPMGPPPGPRPLSSAPSPVFRQTGAFPTVPPPYSGPPAALSQAGMIAASRRQTLGLAALVLSLILLFIAVFEGIMLIHLGDRLTDSELAEAQARASTEQRVTALESRAADLERNTFDSEKIATVVTPSVFMVIAEGGTGTAFAFGQEPRSGGTDFVTNYHVIEDTVNAGIRNVVLERDNKRYTATITTTSEEKDLAIVHTTETFTRLSASTSSAQPGEPIVVIGAPLGEESTVTTGVVSALRETSDGSYVQFDAAINPGNSGGPVVNAQKLVVGVATAKVMDAEGIGYAIPVAVVCDVLGVC